MATGLFVVLAVLLLGNALSGAVYGKMWLQSRLIARDYPNFSWQVFWNVAVAGLMASMAWISGG